MKLHQFLYPFTKFPNFKGKVRFLILLYKMLSSGKTHDIFDAELHHPVPYLVRLDTHCSHELMAYMMGGYETETVEFLVKLYKEFKGNFFDIGANIGLISIPFAKMILGNLQSVSVSNIYAFEAVESNQKTLAYNVSINGLENNIRCLPKALGEIEKEVDIQVEGNLKSNEGTGTANIIASDSDYECERIKITVTTIDNLIKLGEIPTNCQLIKLDTDGYDLFILREAENLIKNSRPIIFGEFAEHCLHWHGQSVTDVIHYMNKFNYKVYAKIKGKWLFKEKFEPKEYVQDLLIVPEEKVLKLSWCLE